MHPVLQEINELYLQIPHYIDPSPEYIESLNRQNEVLKSQPDEHRRRWQLEFAGQRAECSRIYSLAIEKFEAVSSTLSPTEVIEAYKQGCNLLQRNLSGHMSHHFDEAYIPLMIQAVKSGEGHTAHLFLPILAQQLGRDIAPLAIESLDSQFTCVREAALSVVYQLELVEAVSKIRTMADQDPEIAEMASNIIRKLEGRAEHRA